MSAEIVSLKAPPTMALFYSMDADPQVGVRLCTADRLIEAIASTMFSLEPDAKQWTECAALAVDLREKGEVQFEDGWLKLCIGLQAVTDFAMSKVKAAKADERHADRQRFNEMRRGDEAELRYAMLCCALKGALGSSKVAAYVNQQDGLRAEATRRG